MTIDTPELLFARLRTWPSRLVWAAGVSFAISSTACEIGSKSVGMETDTEGNADDGADDGVDDGADGGQTSSPTDPSVGDDGGSGDDGEGDGSTGVACGAPPPIELAECVACDPQLEAFTNDGCLMDCTGQACGEPCLACPDEQPDCLDAQWMGACNSIGQCVVPSGPDACMNVLEPGFETDLAEQGGCADLYVYARNPEDTRGLILRIDDGLVDAVVASDMPMSTELDITDPSVSFRVQSGIAITALECTDVIEMRPVVDETWGATAGSLGIELAPDGNGFALADITLSDVTIERTEPLGGATQIDIPEYVFTDVLVGWLPG